MHLVHLVLTSPGTPQPAPGDAARILDILWARMEPGLGIEHMRARSGPAWIDLGLFFRGDGSDGRDQVTNALDHLLPCIPEWSPKVPD